MHTRKFSIISLMLSQLRGLSANRGASATLQQQVLSRINSDPQKRCTSSGTEVQRVDLNSVRKQIEYYFSDQNLQNDVYLHTKISSNPDGWLPAEELLKFNKLKKMNVTTSDISDALKDSQLLKTRQVVIRSYRSS